MLAGSHQVRILSSHRDWRTETLSFLMITFQKNDFQVFEKNIPELQKHTSQRDPGKIHNFKTLVNVLRKVRGLSLGVG